MIQRFLACGALLAALALALPAAAGVTPYCPPTPNSVGPGATLIWRGPADPGHAQLLVAGVPAHSPLMYVYGTSQVQTPFGSGLLCVQPGFILARSAADASGHASLQIAAEGEQEDVRWLVSGLLSGANFQVVYRDAAGATMNTTGALAVEFE